MHKYQFPLLMISVVCIFFWQFLIKGLLPIPADTIIGLYHPYRDLYSQDYPNGIPYKNFLITDPVRQQYPWRKLGVDMTKTSSLPLWNPYSGTGMPLLGNMQSALLYPLNIIFFFFSFPIGWSLLVMLQPLLAGLFMYWYLIKIGLRREASFLGGISFAFSGFFIAWLEWNTLLHVALWLPFILLIKEHVFVSLVHKKPSVKYVALLFAVLVIAESSYLLAGHVQTAFYVSIISCCYLAARVWQIAKGLREDVRDKFIRASLLFFAAAVIAIAIVTLFQWWTLGNLVMQSSRDAQQLSWMQEGWFIPWQHLVQFIAPDFFGNPTTLNYWGVWNYAEMVGYVGILPLIFAFFALVFRRDLKTFFFGTIFFVSLIFATPTVLAKLPYQTHIPFLSTSQPTRLLFIVDFALSILAALGFDYVLSNNKSLRNIWKILLGLGILFGCVIGFAYWGNVWFQGDGWVINLAVSKRNILFPVMLFASSIIVIMIYWWTIKKGWRMAQKLTTIAMMVIVVFDLLRFGWKFTPFVKVEYLFPATSVISYLQTQPKPFRVMATDKRILPPNFPVMYGIESVDVYDPLFLASYGELVAAWERSKPDISPVNFNRMITPQNYESFLVDLLNVKYVLSLSDIDDPKFKLVFEEGQTKIYENLSVFPRAFLVESVIPVVNKEQAIHKLFEIESTLSTKAVVEGEIVVSPLPLQPDEMVEIATYSPNTVTIKTITIGERLLVLTDSYYPTWKAFVDGHETPILKTDFMFRGILVPEGQHLVEFRIGL